MNLGLLNKCPIHSDTYTYRHLCSEDTPRRRAPARFKARAGKQSANNSETLRLPWRLAKIEALDLNHVPAVVDHQDFSGGFLVFSSSGPPTRHSPSTNF